MIGICSLGHVIFMKTQGSGGEKYLKRGSQTGVSTLQGRFMIKNTVNQYSALQAKNVFFNLSKLKI